ncbi:unnamed protein product [Vitrella brassicaformis CCMP3155]|uniref:Uncharacterized protein n=1 Tax=Vitrella brassicaformis (strain CCMP3155) TaxID=1169540 RepID=A0A0G4EI79_VITBC|nr:unnamed protein product [Vitrella brassicaformis CCMP3155]|eukprot:CEL96701.1 unnamed protein product [Vitrella brassicaformis CCMP3155]
MGPQQYQQVPRTTSAAPRPRPPIHPSGPGPAAIVRAGPLNGGLQPGEEGIHVHVHDLSSQQPTSHHHKAATAAALQPARDENSHGPAGVTEEGEREEKANKAAPTPAAAPELPDLSSQQQQSGEGDQPTGREEETEAENVAACFESPPGPAEEAPESCREAGASAPRGDQDDHSRLSRSVEEEREQKEGVSAPGGGHDTNNGVSKCVEEREEGVLAPGPPIPAPPTAPLPEEDDADSTYATAPPAAPEASAAPEAPTAPEAPAPTLHKAAEWTLERGTASAHGVAIQRAAVSFQRLRNGPLTLPVVQKTIRMQKERLEPAFLYLLTTQHPEKSRTPTAQPPPALAKLARKKGAVPPAVREALDEAFAGDGEGEAPPKQQPGQDGVAVVGNIDRQSDARRQPLGSFLALRVLLYPPGEGSALRLLDSGAQPTAAQEAGIQMANGKRINRTKMKEIAHGWQIRKKMKRLVGSSNFKEEDDWQVGAVFAVTAKCLCLVLPRPSPAPQHQRGPDGRGAAAPLHVRRNHTTFDNILVGFVKANASVVRGGSRQVVVPVPTFIDAAGQERGSLVTRGGRMSDLCLHFIFVDFSFDNGAQLKWQMLNKQQGQDGVIDAAGQERGSLVTRGGKTLAVPYETHIMNTLTSAPPHIKAVIDPSRTRNGPPSTPAAVGEWAQKHWGYPGWQPDVDLWTVGGTALSFLYCHQILPDVKQDLPAVTFDETVIGTQQQTAENPNSSPIPSDQWPRRAVWATERKPDEEGIDELQLLDRRLDTLRQSRQTPARNPPRQTPARLPPSQCLWCRRPSRHRWRGPRAVTRVR